MSAPFSQPIPTRNYWSEFYDLKRKIENCERPSSCYRELQKLRKLAEEKSALVRANWHAIGV